MHTTELGALHRALAAVAPIDGVSIGDATDKSTWRIDFAEGASTAQMTVAEAVLANWTGLDAWKADYARRVDADAEACRLQFITPGAGMAMTYAEKFAQAQAVDTMGEATANALSEPDAQAQFPTLSASVGLEAPTLWDAAQLVIERYAAFAQLSMSIERTRLSGKAAIKAAATVDGVRVAYGAIAWPTA